MKDSKEIFMVVERQPFSGNESIFSTHSTREEAENISTRAQEMEDETITELNEDGCHFHGSDFYVITGKEYDKDMQRYGFVPSTDELSLSNALCIS